ncbi:pyridoxal phosphate-dependent aminotransferase [Clostridium luticellarii]|jgi:aspartate aminotransferase|uniref:pyridoxal phosphate-dependent aminotransferase n=1 Tax=Clostridium luticellarii TaxID=1691940 RepID=UPI002356F6CB|nr:pyridoxal phosphate-dependent aminotransferase [Clostridium luticellarii]MCI1943940.1 pyridoxal phosphate-dependent aminotransferase [Clostridium luticellarii]MCI1967201.1 pyridoxal phosphate-dependent aminotransferase [Clostridium luticellarii]MCI1995932.1 pyridoxal phosphate-dependent aminotransferase [Clostridium luticellarii]MCI2038479.1 pyridoxal phosphate-dependent aminotransferase [Clostridium luticellarii]
MILSKKAEKIQPSITLEITAKAKKMKSQGIDVIGFGAGEPDFNTPENIQKAAVAAMKEGYTKYTPASGILELKEAVVKKFKVDNGLEYSTDQIIISTGAKQCLCNAFQAVLNPGDQVIIAVPYWVSYPELVRLSGGVPVFVDTKEENDFKYTVEDLQKAYTDKTKVIIINSPNNPTGSIYSEEELKQIADFAREKDILILSDEIYEKLIYGNRRHVSIAGISQDAYSRTIVINGVSKTYAMTGWRIGYCAADKDIIKLMSNVQSHTTGNPNSIAQYAALAALNGENSQIENMMDEFKKRREYMIEKIDSIEGLSCLKPEGAFYVMLNISKTFGKTIDGHSIGNSLEFSSLLLEKEKVAVVPGLGFGIDGYVRLSYATSMENIKRGLDRIGQFVSKLK